MAKIGRNAPCPCGSGLKYKWCCGDSLKAQRASAAAQPAVSTKTLNQMLERAKAKELIRTQQQGQGRPIISETHKGYRVVAAGDVIHYSKKWKFFPDFLSDYIRNVLGGDWGNAEIAKPLEDRHPIMQWYDGYCRFQQRQERDSDGNYSAVSTGIVVCFLGLAYNLYLLKHNVELQERLVARLKDPKQFQGAYYELIVANCLIRAGFELTLEDEADQSSKHCEFSAVSKGTGKKYWVEGKSVV